MEKLSPWEMNISGCPELRKTTSQGRRLPVPGVVHVLWMAYEGWLVAHQGILQTPPSLTIVCVVIHAVGSRLNRQLRNPRFCSRLISCQLFVCSGQAF